MASPIQTGRNRSRRESPPTTPWSVSDVGAVPTGAADWSLI